MPDILSPDDIRLQRIQALRQIGMPNAAPFQSAPFGSPDIEDNSESKLQSISTPQLQKITSDDSVVKPLNFHQREALPITTPDAPAGSISANQSRLSKLEDERQNPWGTPENHPGTLGKIGHILSTVGQIAGTAVAPGVVASIPGTALNRQVQENQLQPEIQGQKAEAAKEAVAESDAQVKQQNADSESGLREAQTNNFNNKDSEALAKLGLTRNETSGELTPDPTSPVYQKQQMATEAVHNLMTLRNAQKDLDAARTEVEKAKNDPNSPAFKMAQQRLSMAQYAHDIATKNLGLHQAEFENKVQEQGLLKPSGQAQSRASAAQSVLDVMPELQDAVKKNAAQMGPLMGRINKGEVAIGDVDPEVAKLYAAMKSFYALQPAVHGFRNAEFVKDFETAIGTLERNPDAFLAGMEGLKPTLNAVANEGKTFHKRIVEGGENPPSQGGAKKPPPF